MSGLLPALIADDLRVGAIAAVFAHQLFLPTHGNAWHASLAGSYDLGTQGYFFVLQQFDRLPIGQMVFQVDVEAV